MRLLYSPSYEVNIGGHVFPTAKYRLVRERLLDEKVAKQEDFVLSEKASDEDVLLVHTEEYVQKLKTGTLSMQEIYRLELPYSEALVEASWFCAGGTIQTGLNALEDRIGIHVGGGFHHAFSDHGEGFCVLNDIAIAVRVLQKQKKIARALIIDCDLHQGNGTAAIFADDNSVFTFSIHQRDNYPFPKPPSNMDIELDDRTGDREYITHLKDNIPGIVSSFGPDVIVYVAGADPYQYDQLGGLSLSIQGLAARDELVMKVAIDNNIPIGVVFAGGYAVNTDDTVIIHCNTVKTAARLLS